MAYPPPPGPRLAYDLDGTVVLISKFDGALTMLDLSPTAVWVMNSERTAGLVTFADGTHFSYGDAVWQSTATAEQSFVAFIFPVPTRLYGIFPGVMLNDMNSSFRANGSADVYTSTDTTNGIDGTWTLLATRLNSFGPITDTSYPTTYSTREYRAIDGSFPAGAQPLGLPVNNDNYRRSRAIEGVGWSALSGTGTRHLKGLKICYHATNNVVPPGTPEWGYYRFAGLTTHLYGEPDNGGDEDRLAMWRPDLDVETPATWFDWGDVPLSSSADKSFRLKNISGSLTATDITLSTSASFTDSATSPHPSNMFLYSMDSKVTWHASLSIAALSPGATTGTLWVRRTIPADAPLSNWGPRILAEVETWS